MILEASAEDFAALIAGRAPRALALPDTPIEQPEVLQMLGDLAARVRAAFSPAAWLIVEGAEIVGLCSVMRAPTDGVIEIGYGIAPGRQRRGIAGRAVGEIVDWARATPGIIAITADTAPENIASHQVLVRNKFVQVDERIDVDEGPLLCWRHDLGRKLGSK